MEFSLPVFTFFLVLSVLFLNCQSSEGQRSFYDEEDDQGQERRGGPYYEPAPPAWWGWARKIDTCWYWCPREPWWWRWWFQSGTISCGQGYSRRATRGWQMLPGDGCPSECWYRCARPRPYWWGGYYSRRAKGRPGLRGDPVPSGSGVRSENGQEERDNGDIPPPPPLVADTPHQSGSSATLS